MSRISASRRRLYGLGLGALLLADLAGGAAAVVARASSSPKPPPVAARAAAPSPAPAPSAAPAAAPASDAAPAGPSDCGHGTATALAVLDQTPTGSVLRVTVANNSDRTIQVDHIAVQATYADGVRTFAGGAGLEIVSGATDSDIALPGSASVPAPLAYGVGDFAFHTAGRPDCAAR